MAVCPKCGYEVVNAPEKTWPIPSREPLKEGEKPRLVGIYSCPNCGVRFRSAVKAEPKPVEPEVETPIETPRELQEEPVQTRMDVYDKIRVIETERLTLMEDIGSLKKMLNEEWASDNSRYQLPRTKSYR